MAKHKKLFGGNIEPACVYCEHSRPAPDKVMVLCKKYGPVAPHYHCRHYAYNPVKRKIPRQPALPKFAGEDFNL